ncbi:MAG: PEGA domain-containing protein, partial [Bacteroidales bacterium]|nr:PEGA domain-containing protein [Bacteroidales bacterium]
DEASRKGVIEVTMGKERTSYVLVSQEGHRDAAYTVSIHTVPERAIIYVDQNTGMLADKFQMKEGKHYIRIEKNGFERLDTTIFVPRNPRDADLYHRIELKPTFALLSVDIKSEEGLIFNGDATLDISGRQIEMRPSSLKSFDVDQEVSYYSLYEGNLIPLHPGQYVIRAESDGFKVNVQNFTLEKGQTLHMDFVLSAIYGMLSVQDAENAAGASVFIDEKEVGQVPFNGRIKTGHHTLRVEKDGFVSEHPTYEFDIEEGKENLVNLSMKRFTTYHFTSDPAYCKVYVDGALAGTTPLKVQLAEGLHQFQYEKAGYFPVTEEFATDVSVAEKEYRINMNKTFPLTITSDEDSLRITVTKGSGNNKITYVDNVKTPATVELPVSKSLYRIKLTRGNLTKAYDGYFWFRGKRDHIKLLSYSKENFRMFGVNYYLKRPAPMLVDSKYDKPFQRIGEVTLAELMLFPGLTTCAVKGAFFWPTDTQKHFHYPANAAGQYALEPGDENYQDVTFLPALTVLFLNEEFRLGGALHNNVDIDLLATYSWYPNLSKIAPFTHVSGHDIFLGGEISSRIPIFNVNIKAGLQAFYGQANICRPNGVVKSSAAVQERFVVEPYKVPYNDAQFVISVGIKLGTRDSKGNNILRVF